MEKSQLGIFKSKLNRIAWLTMFAIFSILLLLSTFFAFKNIQKNKSLLTNNLRSNIISQKSYFLSEVYLSQKDALMERIDSIIRQVKKENEDINICFLVKSYMRNGITIKKCNDKFTGSSNLEILAKNEINLSIDNQKIGSIKYKMEFDFNPLSFIPVDLITTLVITSIIVLAIQLLFARVINNKVVSPLVKEIEDNERNRTSAKIASQVSHDIRSPLTALSVAINDCDNIEEEERIIIRTQIHRITDIANSLLLKNKRRGASEISYIQNVLVSATLEESLTEKRLEYRSNMNISIEGDFENSYGLFAKLNPVDLKTIISNCINNSVEALKSSSGRINLKIQSTDYFIIVKVTDNGTGMSRKVLENLGKVGFSYGKENNDKSGSGVGVSSSMEIVKNQWGGEMSYSSKEGEGTTMTITLPKQNPPKWFMPKFIVKRDSAVVVLDDDIGIHDIWKKRINIGKRLFHFSTPDQLKKWISDESSHFKSVQFLCDYELIGNNKTGLDLAEELNLSNVVLVTSHYGDPKIIKRCSELNIQLIPKMHAGAVPIIIENSDIMKKNDEKLYDAVHLEDDYFIRRMWKKAAEKSGISLLSCEREDELFLQVNKIKKNAKFYIDIKLGDEHISGSKVAKKVFNLGFRNIFLATGYDAEDFKDIEFLTGVVGKRPCF